MNGVIYLSSTARTSAEAAQAELERHLVTAPSGRCVTCGAEEPCPGRWEATRRLLRYGRLPRRTPGMARSRTPDVAASPRNVGSWFEPLHSEEAP